MHEGFVNFNAGTLGASMVEGRISEHDESRVVKALELSGASNVLFRRNSVTGTIEAVPWQGEGIALNAALHAN